MTDLGRRDFLQSVAAASAMTAITTSAAEAAVQGKAPGKLSDIDHFIILMKENRSFDHYFGTLRGVRGFDDPAANLRTVLTPADTRDKVGQGELRTATLFTAALVAAACNADPAEVERWRR